MNSFSILRTNVGLTTNVKITIDSNYNLSLNSIDSNASLSSDKYKNYKFNKNNFYDDLISAFFKKLPADIAFKIKYNNDVDNMSSNFSEQYDEIYNYGARNIIDNKNYEEEYEYFAPLYFQNNLPKNFIIFRIDGPGIESLNKENFKDNILNKLKFVKLFDLTIQSNLGQWLDKNFVSNEYFPHSPLEIYFETLEFSKWNGIDYENGGYTSKSLFLEEIFEKEREIFELEKLIFDNYKNTKTIFPNILNLSFLFDDTPSTPDVERKWSLNRYLGFYVDDMELSTTISPYEPPKLRQDFEILDNNFIYSQSNPDNPFIEDWSENKPFYIEYKGEYYLVKRYTEKRGEEINDIKNDEFINEEYQNVIFYNYKIISDIDLSGKESEVNTNYGFIDSNNVLRTANDSYFNISDFDEADVWLVKIDGIYHNIIKDNNDNLKINSDYSFNFKNNYFEYKVASKLNTISTIVDNLNQPKKFDIFKLKFTDIKDFDTRIIDTEYSKYEYEEKEEITDTSEPKMYFQVYSKDDDILELDKFKYKDDTVNIPVSSEYTANYETFKIENEDLSDIWRINPVYCRWGFQNSLSNNDYPYLLNNAKIFEEYNKSPDPFIGSVSRRSRNLDYFYTINSSTSSYVHHSLHIEEYDNEGSLDTSFKFDIDKYLNTATYSVGTYSFNYNFDYFTSFFERPAYFDNLNIKKNVKKYSYFNKGDNSIPNLTVFKGLEFKIYTVNSLSLDENRNIDKINIANFDEFNDYKFSILLSENPNNMEWIIPEQWDPDKVYQQGDIVLFDDIIYESIGDNNKSSIASSDWSFYYNNDSILWNPNKQYTDINIGTPSIIYNTGEYYYCNNTNNNIDFWNPFAVYNVDDIVLYRNNYYLSLTSSNTLRPTYEENSNKKLKYSLQNYKNWKPINEPNLDKVWELVKVWNPSDQYLNNSIVKHEDIVYISTLNVEIGEEPGISISWNRLYNILPDNDYVYKPGDNAMILMNNKYYLIASNDDDDTLDNGINIYINKKWKNILVNIYINDNTLNGVSNNDRDNLYTDFYSLLIASNFIRSINDISKKYDFINYLKYTIIDEQGNISNYDYENNIEYLPYIISCETPAGIVLRKDSLIKTPIDYSFNTDFRLSDKKIDKISKLNWYNNTPIAYSISENKIFNEDSQYIQIHRFSGYYMPIFYDIDLFDKNSDYKKIGNYLFDTNLSDFGLMKERKNKKVNRNGSILKLRNSNNIKSIFPMIDEYGYNYGDFLIFKSTWDLEYHIETVKNKEIFIKKPELKIELPRDIGQPTLVKLENNKKYLL